MNQIQLTTCDQEPIHIPGKIQAHGFLIATDYNFNVTHCSENVKSFLGVSAIEILGKSLNFIPGFDGAVEHDNGLAGMINILSKQNKSQKTVHLEQSIRGKSFDAAVHRNEQGYVIDFEPELSNLHSDIQGLVGRSLSEMLGDKDFTNLLINASNQVREIIGYDRVMIYKFHADGHGEVVAESKNDILESWMGLHYPASDIPVQARELYKVNQVRLIANVMDETSAIVALADHATPLDLSLNSLRAVSPVHIQYLINMGVASSFSISIIYQDELWGLIACHNYTPRFINIAQRETAKLVGQVLSSAIGFRSQELEQKQTAQHSRAIEGITRNLLRNIPIQDALINDQEHKLIDVLPCTGAALHFENEFSMIGRTPPKEFMKRLINWLDQQSYTEGYYVSNQLSTAFPEAEKYKDCISGLLACRLGKDLNEYLLWFRPEKVSTVKWAGEPAKVQELDSNGLLRISPRNSFREWMQEVRLHSEQWQKHELVAALSLRDEVNYSISRKATELRIINEKLRIAYAELDAFSYTISHDLKTPLTTIKSYSELIAREGMSPDRMQSMAKKITDGAVKMQRMIDEVLQYSQVGQSNIQTKAVNMHKLLEELRQDLLVSSKNANLVIEVSETPDLYGDELMIFQVFSNIVGNAVKYSSKTTVPRVTISGRYLNDEIIYSIADNGIGIPEEQHDTIFNLFSRASTSTEFEGTGVGLAIVKRILEKHHGRIWLESEPGKGSVFSLGFARPQILTTLN